MYHRRYIHCWSSTTSRSVFGSILQGLFWTVAVENHFWPIRLTDWYIWDGINAVVHIRIGFKTAHYEFHDKGKIKPRKFLVVKTISTHFARPSKLNIAIMRREKSPRKLQDKGSSAEVGHRIGSVWNVRGAVVPGRTWLMSYDTWGSWDHGQDHDRGQRSALM